MEYIAAMSKARKVSKDGELRYVIVTPDGYDYGTEGDLATWFGGILDSEIRAVYQNGQNVTDYIHI